VDVGHELRQARERREMSLLQLSRITKISPRVLQVLEASDGRRLPARVFTRAFVRSYAREVGLDPDDTVRRYFEQFAEAEPEIPADIERAAEAKSTQSSFDASLRAAADAIQGRFGTAAVLTIVVVTLVVLLARSGNAPQVDAAASVPAAVATAGSTPASGTQPVAVATGGSAPATTEPLRIAIAPTGPCWVQASMKDERLFGGMLNAGDRRTIDAPSEVTLRVGDPSTFAFTIDGRRARIGGTPAQAVTVLITRENYTQFLVKE
jgi:cytoskeletal protein RodZ